jgi:ABC-type sugar transport system ATPase subunit
LRIISGLMPVDSGEVLYDGVPVTDLSPAERRVGMVFQNYSLYPNLSSRENVRSFFRFRKHTPEMDALERAKYERTCELMGVELTHLLDRMPKSLSGGEQQRVAIARCVTRDAAVFLVDEPFSNLDQPLRERYRFNLKILLNEYGVTTVYVTHDHNEAMLLADVVAVMGRGVIEQVGTVQELYDEPANDFVAGFVRLHQNGVAISLLDAADVPSAEVLGDVRIGVRPEEIGVGTQPDPGAVEGIVTGIVELPPHNERIVSVRVGAHDIQVRGAEGADCVQGDRVWLQFRRAFVFDRLSGRRLRTLTAGGPSI